MEINSRSQVSRNSYRARDSHLFLSDKALRRVKQREIETKKKQESGEKRSKKATNSRSASRATFRDIYQATAGARAKSTFPTAHNAA